MSASNVLRDDMSVGQRPVSSIGDSGEELQAARSVKTVVPCPRTVSPVKTPFSPSHKTRLMLSAVWPGVLRHLRLTRAISGTSFHFGLPASSCLSRCRYTGSMMEIISPGMTGWNGCKGESGVNVPGVRVAHNAASEVARSLASGLAASSASSGEGNFHNLGGGQPCSCSVLRSKGRAPTWSRCRCVKMICSIGGNRRSFLAEGAQRPYVPYSVR